MVESSREAMPTHTHAARFVVTSHSAHGAPAALTILDHPAVVGIVVSRDLGDARSSAPTLRGVPCFLIDFVSAEAATEALERLRVISSRFTHAETPSRIASSSGVPFTLRLVRGFAEATIAAIDACHAEAVAIYGAAQTPPHQMPRTSRR